MASFRTHISFGMALGILSALALMSWALADGPSMMIAVFTAAALGSVLPDMDSDTSVPFHVTFGSLSTVAAALMFISIYKRTPGDWDALILWTAGTAFFIWGVIGYLFKRFTHHRGMAHSIPAALLAGLITFFAAAQVYFPDTQAFLLGLAMIAGYLIHLILDEIHAALNFHNRPFIPNKALGSALKFWSNSSIVNAGVFIAILLLASGNVQRIKNLAESFWNKVS